MTKEISFDPETLLTNDVRQGVANLVSAANRLEPNQELPFDPETIRDEMRDLNKPQEGALVKFLGEWLQLIKNTEATTTGSTTSLIATDRSSRASTAEFSVPEIKQLLTYVKPEDFLGNIIMEDGKTINEDFLRSLGLMQEQILKLVTQANPDAYLARSNSFDPAKCDPKAQEVFEDFADVDYINHFNVQIVLESLNALLKANVQNFAKNTKIVTDYSTTFLTPKLHLSHILFEPEFTTKLPGFDALLKDFLQPLAEKIQARERKEANP